MLIIIQEIVLNDLSWYLILRQVVFKYNEELLSSFLMNRMYYS